MDRTGTEHFELSMFSIYSSTPNTQGEKTQLNRARYEPSPLAPQATTLATRTAPEAPLRPKN